MDKEKIKAKIAELTRLLDEEETPIEINFSLILYVKPEDEPYPMTWKQAMEKFGCNGSDKEWRLPTILELHVMTEAKKNIPNLKLDEWYWSSSENFSSNAYVERFSDAYQGSSSKNRTNYVRCVHR